MKKLLLAAALSVSVYGGYRVLGGGSSSAQHGEKLVIDRFWIDHIPRSEKDMIEVFVAVSEDATGVFHKGSRWQGQFELFQFESHGGELRVVYPQSGQREQLRAKVTKCKQGGMDYCLDLEGGTRGVKRYYSMEDWVIDHRSDVEAKLKQLTARR